MISLRCMAEFGDQQVVIRDHMQDLGQIFSKGVHVGGLYDLDADPIKHTIVTNFVSFGTRDLATCTMELYFFCRIWCMDYLIFRKKKLLYVRHVHLANISRLLFLVLSTTQKES